MCCNELKRYFRWKDFIIITVFSLWSEPSKVRIGKLSKLLFLATLSLLNKINWNSKYTWTRNVIMRRNCEKVKYEFLNFFFLQFSFFLSNKWNHLIKVLWPGNFCIVSIIYMLISDLNDNKGFEYIKYVWPLALCHYTNNIYRTINIEPLVLSINVEYRINEPYIWYERHMLRLQLVAYNIQNYKKAKF